jgi:hypothetical protein
MRTEMAAPGVTPLGTRTLTWFRPTYPGAAPNHRT